MCTFSLMLFLMSKVFFLGEKISYMTYLNKSLKGILKIFVNWLFWENFNTRNIKKLFKKLVRSFTSVYAKFYI